MSDLFGNIAATDVVVTEQNAMQVSAFWACVRIISETVASLPLHVYERVADGGKVRAPTHPTYAVLHSSGNEEMTAFTVRELLMTSLLVSGNAYAEKEFDAAGRLRGLWPLRWDRVTAFRTPDGPLAYQVILPNGQQVILPRERVLHLTGFGGDGIKGASVLATAREAIGLSLATEKYGAKFFGNGAKPGGVLEHPMTMSQEAMERLRNSWNDMHSGLERSHRIAILEEGMTYKQIGLPPEDSQFLETRRFQIEEIARIFRVPLHLIGSLERATFSNIEHQSIDFVVHCIRPWLVRLEQAMMQQLFTPAERERYFVEFNVDGLLRGDLLTRYQAYQIGRQNGWLSADDIRRFENMDPLPGTQGDIYLVPLNMVPAELATEAAQSRSSGTLLEKRATDFPAQGDDETVSLRNSEYELFPLDVAQDLRENWPSIWDRGGNIQGNDTYAVLLRVRELNKAADELTDREIEIVRMREAWSARHAGDFRLNGVVAQIKWHMVGDRGLRHMLDVIQEEKDRISAERGVKS
jgi:HK97 family phage portal protein